VLYQYSTRVWKSPKFWVVPNWSSSNTSPIFYSKPPFGRRIRGGMRWSSAAVPCKRNNLLPKETEKYQILITHNGVWDPMQLDHLPCEYFCQGTSGVEVFRGTKCPYLLNLSTTTKIASYPFELDSLTMKSILIYSHITSGIGKGCNKPCGEHAWFLFLWQITQPNTKLVIIFFVPLQYNDWAILLYVMNIPECPSIGVVWMHQLGYPVGSDW